MRTRGLAELFANNRRWVERVKSRDPHFFEHLSEIQDPRYLWIGCADSRVPSNQIIDLPPGEVFVHRNIANVVHHADLNMLAVLQFAVDVLKVEHILVCGHYGCGGVQAALENNYNGLVDNWVRPIKDIYWQERKRIDALQNNKERLDLLCELNVKTQVLNVAHTSIVQNAWAHNQQLSVHGIIYGLSDGLLKDLEVSISDAQSTSSIYRYNKQ